MLKNKDLCVIDKKKFDNEMKQILKGAIIERDKEWTLGLKVFNDKVINSSLFDEVESKFLNDAVNRIFNKMLVINNPKMDKENTR